MVRLQITPVEVAERLGIQLPRARQKKLLKTNDLVREAVCCNAGLDGSL